MGRLAPDVPILPEAPDREREQVQELERQRISVVRAGEVLTAAGTR